MSSHLKTIVIWLVVIAAVVIGYQIFDQAGKQREQLDQSTFYRALEDGQIAEVTLNGDAVGYEIRGEFKGSYPGPNGQSITRFSTYIVKDEELMKTPAGASRAGEIYARARPLYHAISRRTLERTRAKLSRLGLIEHVTWMNSRHGGRTVCGTHPGPVRRRERATGR